MISFQVSIIITSSYPLKFDEIALILFDRTVYPIPISIELMGEIIQIKLSVLQSEFAA